MGTDTVSMGMGFLRGCDKQRVAVEKSVKVQLCVLVPTVDSHIFSCLINLAIFLEMRAFSFKVERKTRFPPEMFPNYL